MAKAFKVKVHTYKYDKASGVEKTVHQTSPSWVLTFIRWENRDTYRNKGQGDAVREPMVVVNDCISVTVSQSKRSHTPSMTATLRCGDINYATAVSPGDFVFVNILDWQKDADHVAEKAKHKQPINGDHDGFKGLFKIQSVRMIIGINPENGAKQLMYQITGFGMTELNNTIYFNDQVIPQEQGGKTFLFFERTGILINSLILEKGQNNIQLIIQKLISLCLGAGPSELAKQDKGGTLISPNSIFIVPSLVGTLLGVKANTAMDIYRFIFGIQKYSAGATKSLSDGLNPTGLRRDGNFYITDSPCTGTTMVKPDYWNQITAWSLLQQYSNYPINEMFTSFKLNPDGKIMPTVTLRQIPFTTEQFKGNEVTRFLSLPRWELDPAMIYDFNIGRDEAARINFVMVFGRSNMGVNNNFLMASQVEQGNFAMDSDDIRRNGLRPWIITSNFDFPTNSDKSVTKSPYWASLMADSIIGGHLKMNGTIRCAGIQEPIAPGENLQLGDVVYHIETVTHSASISVNGEKKFETILELSNGVDARSNENALIYSQMSNVDIQDEIRYDRKTSNILPGVSDSQFSYARTEDGDNKARKDIASFKPSASNQKQISHSDKPMVKKPTPSKGGRK